MHQMLFWDCNNAWWVAPSGWRNLLANEKEASKTTSSILGKCQQASWSLRSLYTPSHYIMMHRRWSKEKPGGPILSSRLWVWCKRKWKCCSFNHRKYLALRALDFASDCSSTISNCSSSYIKLLRLLSSHHWRVQPPTLIGDAHI